MNKAKTYSVRFRHREEKFSPTSFQTVIADSSKDVERWIGIKLAELGEGAEFDLVDIPESLQPIFFSRSNTIYINETMEEINVQENF